MNSQKVFIVVFSLVSMPLGCSKDTSAPATSTSGDAGVTARVAGTEYLLASEPESAAGVIKAREEAKDGDQVVVVGRIGGSANPWIDGRAAFSIVDESLQACSDIPGDSCPKPWDYCCETARLPTATALVKVVDPSGQLVATDAKQLLGVDELATVVVKGKAQRDDAQNLTVLATGVFVREK